MGTIRLISPSVLMAAALCFCQLATPLSLPSWLSSLSSSLQEVKDPRVKRSPRFRDIPIESLGPVDALVLVCDNLQDSLDVCSNVPTVKKRFRPGQIVGGSQVDPSPEIVSSRQKRAFSDFWNFDFPSFPNFPYGDNGGNDKSNDSNTTSIMNTTTSKSHDFFDDDFFRNFGRFSHGQTYMCPSQTNQSAVYQFSANITDYPAVELAGELSNDLAFFAVLVRQAVLIDDPPELLQDDFLATSNASCPFSEQRLVSYFSVSFGVQCFVMLNFQEDIVYKNCLTDSPVKPDGHYKDPFDDPFFRRSPVKMEERCLTEYTRVSLWAFCPSRPAGQRVVRDRIIVPTACTSFGVPCTVAESG